MSVGFKYPRFTCLRIDLCSLPVLSSCRARDAEIFAAAPAAPAVFQLRGDDAQSVPYVCKTANLRRELPRIPFVRDTGAEAQEAGPHDAGLKPGSSTAASTDDGSAGDAGITVAGGDARAPVNPRETLPRSAQTMWAGKVLG
jgi:hypothetical protein